MKEFDEDYLEHLKSIISDDKHEEARTELASLHPADIAELYRNLELEQAEYLFKLLDEEKAADVLMELDEDDRLKLLNAMPAEEIAKQIDHLDTDDAVDLIQQLDQNEREEILSHIDDVEQAGDIIDLLKYDEDTAGGLMGTEMIVVNENWSMPECIKQMRLQAEDMDEIYYVYVVDNEDRLRGTFPLKKMLTHPSVSKIKHVMETDPVSVKVDTPIDEVALDFEKYDLVAMPVVDSIGRLLGRITVDDVMDQVREASERDYQLASGISSDVDADDSVFAQTKARIPWLLVGIAGHSGNFRVPVAGRYGARAVYSHNRRHWWKCRRAGVCHRGAGSCQRFARYKELCLAAWQRGSHRLAQRVGYLGGGACVQPDYDAGRFGRHAVSGRVALRGGDVCLHAWHCGASYP